MNKKNKGQYYLERGLCIHCGSRPHTKEKTRCKVCLEKEATYGKEYRSREENKRRKLEYNRARRKDLRNRGLCVNCGKEKACNRVDFLGRVLKNLLCEKCYLKEKAYKYLGRSDRWEELKELFEKQKGRCALSKKEIQIGHDAHLDHIKPRLSHRGLTTLNNLQWTEAMVNLGKRNKTGFDYEAWLKKEYKRYFGE